VQLAHFRLQPLYLSILLNLQDPKSITSKWKQLATLHTNAADILNLRSVSKNISWCSYEKK
jgi:hypothetical protein